MDSNEHPVRQIDRIASEISGILHAIGESAPEPSPNQDPETRERLAAARERQLAERERFLKRYQAAIMAFIHTILKDTDAAATVWDEFVSKWLSGGLGRFDPEKGSFRKYLKTILRNDCRQHWAKQARRREEVRLASEYEQEDRLQSDAEAAFDRQLRDAVLKRATEAVEQVDQRYHQIIEFMTQAAGREEAKPSTSELTRHLSLQLGRDYTEANVRQLKKRAKDCFAEKMIEQTGLLIDSNYLNDIEEALSDLNLLTFCGRKVAALKA